jgi:hypothetical protein
MPSKLKTGNKQFNTSLKQSNVTLTIMYFGQIDPDHIAILVNIKKLMKMLKNALI